MKKHNNLLALIIGIAVLAGILCSGIILAAGIQNGSAAFTRQDSPRREKYPEPHTLEKTELEEFSEISICLNYANVSILPSDGFYLEYRLDGTCSSPDYGVSNGKFHFQEGQLKQNYRISLNLFGNPANQKPMYLNLYVPRDQYFDLLSMSIESGDLEMDQLNAEKMELSLEYGDLTLGDFSGNTLNISSESGNIDVNDVTCESLNISASYGHFTGNAVSASKTGKFRLESGDLEISSLTADTCSIDSDYGDCSIDSFQAGEIAISLESGNLKISSLTADTCSIDSDYGNCSIDGFQAGNSTFSMESGSLNLENARIEQTKVNAEYGDVTLELADKVTDYNVNLDAEYGTVEINGENIDADEDGTVHYQKKDSKIKHEISVRCESGNINIR